MGTKKCKVKHGLLFGVDLEYSLDAICAAIYSSQRRFVVEAGYFQEAT
jgi:hypothetical protein